MKNAHFFFAILLIGILLCPVKAVLGANLVETTREISRNFEISGYPSLEISNKFGNIAVSQWDRNEISVSVKITSIAATEEASRKMSERISIDFRQSGHNIQAITNISTGNSQRVSGKNSFQIDYTVKVPASAQLTLNNQYGDISMDQTDRNFKAVISFGKLTAERMNGNKNDIRLSYGDMHISEITDLSLEMKFSKARFTTCGTVNMTSSYSEFSTEFAGSMNASSKFDRLNIGTIDKLVLTVADYGNFQITNLQNSLNISSLRFSQLNVGKVSRHFSSIDVDGSYSEIRIGIDQNQSYKADLYTEYASIKGPGIAPKTESTKSRFSGTVGTSDPSGEVRIHSQFGNISMGK